MTIIYKDAAVRDIAEKVDYISDVLKNKTAAQKLATSIIHAVSLLAGNPKMGAMLSGKYEVKTDLRYIIVSKQLVFYQIIDRDRIAIVRVLDGRQDYMAILFGK